jgi:ribosomal protein S18 acetylase RimI-like enzyme
VARRGEDLAARAADGDLGVNLGNPDRPVGGLSVGTPPGVELRPLGRDDFAIALELVRELYELPHTDADVEQHRARYDALIGNVDATPFLALADGEPAGLVIFRFRRRLNFATFEGWVSDLYVRPAFRGRRIGSVLIKAVMEEWRLRQGHALTLETGYSNVAARGLYEALGFRNAGKYFQQRPLVVRGVVAAAGGEVRPAGEDDFEAVTRLLAELGRPAPTEDRLPALRRTYLDHIRRADTDSQLVLLDGTIVGFCSLEFREPFFTTAPQAWIPDFIVTDAFRGRGLGAQLLDATLAAAAQRGAYAAVLESGLQRTVAHQLYTKAGFVDVGSFFTYPK